LSQVWCLRAPPGNYSLSTTMALVEVETSSREHQEIASGIMRLKASPGLVLAGITGELFIIYHDGLGRGRNIFIFEWMFMRRSMCCSGLESSASWLSKASNL